MATLRQRLERALKGTPSRSLKVTLALKRTFSRRGRTLFVTSFPKSGSSFLVSALEETTGYLRYFLGYDFLNEQNLYLPRLLDAYSMNVVAHHHTQATTPNLRLMREFGIRPVILVRNIHDTLASLHDHLNKESRETPTFTAYPSFFSLSPAGQLDCLIDLAAPWFIAFYAGWRYASQEPGSQVLWLSYEQMMASKAQAVRNVLRFHGLKDRESRADGVVARLSTQGDKTRLNVGVSGRGYARFTDAQRGRVEALFRHFPDVDFSPILRRNHGGTDKMPLGT